MEESRLQREDRKVKQYAINYGMTEAPGNASLPNRWYSSSTSCSQWWGMTEVQLKDLVRARRRNGSIPPADYFWPDSYPGNYCDTRIQPIPFGELRGTIED